MGDKKILTIEIVSRSGKKKSFNSVDGEILFEPNATSYVIQQTSKYIKKIQVYRAVIKNTESIEIEYEVK